MLSWIPATSKYLPQMYSNLQPKVFERYMCGARAMRMLPGICVEFWRVLCGWRRRMITIVKIQLKNDNDVVILAFKLCYVMWPCLIAETEFHEYILSFCVFVYIICSYFQRLNSHRIYSWIFMKNYVDVILGLSVRAAYKIIKQKYQKYVILL